MKKPQKRKKEYYDYHECADYISQKYFKGRDLRDFADFDYSKTESETNRYLDFWHWLCDFGNMHNGCFMFMPPASDIPRYSDEEKWVAPIIQAFEDEFGIEAEMWVEW